MRRASQFNGHTKVEAGQLRRQDASHKHGEFLMVQQSPTSNEGGCECGRGLMARV